MKQTFSTITIIISIAFFALLVPQAVISEEKTNKPEKKEVGIKDYDFSYWLSFMNYHPQILIEMGDTAELLFSTRKGKTLDQLEKEGFKVSEERIAILKAMNLLKEVKVYKTAFPIMDPEETRYMRTISKKIALDMATPLKEDIQELMSYLKSEGYSKNAYTILFSYVLDNLVWKEFRKIDGFITHEDFTPEKPIWNGLIYAMYTPRASNCGTNSSSSKGITLSVNWSEASMDLISKVRKDSAVSDMFKDLQEYGEFKNKKAIKVCKSYNICDSNGNLKIPYIKEDTQNELYSMSKELAEKVAKEVLSWNDDLEMLRMRYELKSKNEVIVVMYHEIMWDLLDYLEAEGIIKKPKIFADPEKADMKDVADVMMIVKETVEEKK